jgi:hypothetical protein
VVKALLKLAVDPKNAEIVGADGVVKILLDRVAPRVAEKITGRRMHQTQLEDAPPAGDTPGAVRSPIPEGTGVSGGWRER